MHRSSSSPSSLYSSFKPNNIKTDIDQNLLPTYDPLSHVAQKEQHRLKSAQKAIHLIPLLVLLCAIILWFFSSPLPQTSESTN
ncbi:hypothetical protein TanjilG_25851 [Lupinus angustifolius]|uniref:Transmembrane protein n=1 Tax=Lupinus angustifolius TaxID=3871 RepID=A0A1J7G2E4_LUPAN|nr:hypothetical protein TanjilG_25851 [Lupinus angustifolius]